MELVTLDRMSEMSGALKELNDSTWPEFLLRADIRNWSSIYTEIQGFQILVLEHSALVTAGVLFAVGVLVRPIYRRKGLSRKILSEMRSLSEVKGLRGVLAPVRPNRKHVFPVESIETYANRRDEKGRLLDPWLRVHEEMDGERLGFMHESLTVTASIQDWEKWTGMRFSTSGSYCIPDGLAPVSIDLETNRGTYREPNVWYFHRSRLQD